MSSRTPATPGGDREEDQDQCAAARIPWRSNQATIGSTVPTDERDGHAISTIASWNAIQIRRHEHQRRDRPGAISMRTGGAGALDRRRSLEDYRITGAVPQFARQPAGASGSWARPRRPYRAGRAHAPQQPLDRHDDLPGVARLQDEGRGVDPHREASQATRRQDDRRRVRRSASCAELRRHREARSRSRRSMPPSRPRTTFTHATRRDDRVPRQRWPMTTSLVIESFDEQDTSHDRYVSG